MRRTRRREAANKLKSVSLIRSTLSPNKRQSPTPSLKLDDCRPAAGFYLCSRLRRHRRANPPASQTAPAAVGRVRVKRRLHAKRLLVCERCTYIKGCAERGEQREAFGGVGIGKQSQRENEWVNERERERESFLPLPRPGRSWTSEPVSSPFAFHDVIVRGHCGWHRMTPTPRQPRRRDTRHCQGRTRTENRTRLCSKSPARNCLRMVIRISSYFPLLFSLFLSLSLFLYEKAQ